MASAGGEVMGFAIAQPIHFPPDTLPAMTQYRRHFQPGGSYFFTVNLVDRRLCLLTEQIELLRAPFRYTLQRHPFTVEVIVVLRNISMPFGPCHRETRISRRAGDLSKATFRARCLCMNAAQLAALAKENAASGNGDIGNTHCATRRILNGMRITSIST